MASVIFLKLFAVRLDRLSCDKLSSRSFTAHAHREVGRAGTARAEGLESLFYESVLKRVEGNDTQPSADVEAVKRLIQRKTQMFKLVVDLNAYRLKGLFAGILIAPCLLRNTVFYDICKLERSFYRLLLSCLNYPRGNASCELFLAVLKYDL